MNIITDCKVNIRKGEIMDSNKSNLNRRKFLTASISTVAAAGLTGISSKIVMAGDKQIKAEGKIISRQLGKTGMKIPIVSMGCASTSDPGIIQKAYELGVRHYDTAANYQFGRNEQLLGNVFNRNGKRDEVIIATKIFTPDQRQDLTVAEAKKKAVQLLDGSLKRLKTDYVDILYVHSLTTAEEVSNPVMVEAMKHLKDTGKVRAIGVATHSNMADILNETARLGDYDVVLTSVNFTMANDDNLIAAIDNVASKGIGVVAMKTQAGGSRWPNPESRKDYSSSVIATAALKWVLNNEKVTTSIPAFTSYDFLNEDFALASDIEYTSEEKKLLSDNDIRVSLGFCRQCHQCLASCPVESDIPTLMRTHMYSAQYGDFYLARTALNDISEGKGIQACMDCESCVAVCSNSVDIPHKIDELKLIFS
jgi:predicted aldo/keto reductase-like oxidoreductase